MKSRLISSCCAVLLASTLPALPAAAQGTLRIGMTASDIPLTTGQADQGGEGQRFMALTVYDALAHLMARAHRRVIRKPWRIRTLRFLPSIT